MTEIKHTSDLKTGMLIELEDGRKAVFVRTTASGNRGQFAYPGDLTNSDYATYFPLYEDDIFPVVGGDRTIKRVWSAGEWSSTFNSSTKERLLLYPASTVKLNETYKAQVLPNGVKVGCQTFPFSAIEELYKKIQEMR